MLMENPVVHQLRIIFVIQTGSGVYSASYPMGIVCLFARCKSDGACTWSLTSNQWRHQESMGL